MLGGMGMNTDNVKEIVSTFLKMNINDIDISTKIDNKAIRGSVLLHRMYSELKSNGFKVENYNEIHTFGELIERLSGNKDKNSIKNSVPNKYEFNTEEHAFYEENIGIDIESPNNLPDSLDYYHEQFYVDNFSIGEIAYCSAMDDPKSCFAGRFAAKEAIIKANNSYKDTKFSKIEIKVSETGRPTFSGMALSISHVHYENISLSTAVAKNIISNNIVNDKLHCHDVLENSKNDNNFDIHNNSKQYHVYIIVFLASISFYFFLDKYVLITI